MRALICSDIHARADRPRCRIDGGKLIGELKANEAYKNIPVIITSNLSQKEDIDKAKALGATEFIIKSDISLDDLVTKVQKLLAG